MIPIGIELHKLTIDALLNGASMFIVPIVHPCEYYKSRNQQAIRIEAENDSWYKDRNYCIREEGGGWQDLTKKDFLKYVNAPLQADDEFFIQEEFSLDEILLGGEEVLCKNDFMPRDFKSSAIGYGLTTDYMKERILKRCSWIDASQMTYEQSRYKDIKVDVEVKRVQDIYGNYKSILMNTPDELGYIESDFKQWFNSQFDVKYEDNPYVFLYTVKSKDIE